MGQLEKYGLYVMCLVIFLILGVTLWGEPANATRTAGREQAAMHAGGSVPQDASFQRTSSRPSDLDELLGPPAQQPPRYQRGESSSRQAGSQQAEGRSSSLNDVLKEKVEPVAKPETKAEPVTRPEAALSTVRQKYTVKKGDVLSKIAQQQCGSFRMQQKIIDLNPELDSPDDIWIGQKLVLPSPAELDVAPRQSANKAVATKAYRTYRIRKGDTYAAIASRMLGSSSRQGELIQMNADKPPRLLQPGDRIRLPLN